MVNILLVCLFINWVTDPQALELKLKLLKTFSTETKNNILFEPSNICLAESNSIFIYDRGDYSIKKLDSELNLLHSFGRKGKGPGEFNSKALQLASDKERYLVTADMLSNKITVFDLNGEYVNTLNIGMMDFLIESIVVHNDFIYFVTQSTLFKFSVAGEKIFQKKLKDINRNSFYNMNQKYLMVHSEKELILFWNDNYTIEKYDFNGKLLTRFSKVNFKNYPYDDVEKKKMPQMISKSIPNGTLPSVANNVFILKDYLFVYLKPRSKWKYKYRVDVFSLINNKHVASIENDSNIPLENAVTNNINYCYSILNKDNEASIICKYQIEVSSVKK